ncbi:Uncharacterised protein [Metakosakonia massiliensis]|uniref:Uncharacterized protein n=1 Tax=Phytobacter massiliensis TaxID=1485952 RepID=A0A6N3E448_9ENTR
MNTLSVHNLILVSMAFAASVMLAIFSTSGMLLPFP